MSIQTGILSVTLWFNDSVKMEYQEYHGHTEARIPKSLTYQGREIPAGGDIGMFSNGRCYKTIKGYNAFDFLRLLPQEVIEMVKVHQEFKGDQEGILTTSGVYTLTEGILTIDQPAYSVKRHTFISAQTLGKARRIYNAWRRGKIRLK